MLGVILFSKYETPQSRRYLSSFLFIVSIMEYDIFERSRVAQNVENFFFSFIRETVDYSTTNLFLDIQEFIFWRIQFAPQIGQIFLL